MSHCDVLCVSRGLLGHKRSIMEATASVVEEVCPAPMLWPPEALAIERHVHIYFSDVLILRVSMWSESGCAGVMDRLV